MIFTLDQSLVQPLRLALEGMREARVRRQAEQAAFDNSPDVIQFRSELEEVKRELQSADKNWLSLDRIARLENGELRVRLNPSGTLYNCGWYTIADLQAWVNDKGPIVERRS